MSMRLSCPNCGQHYEVDESFAGQMVECEKCGEAFAIPKIAVVESAPVAPPPKPKPAPNPAPAPKKSQDLGCLGWIILIAAIIGFVAYSIHQSKNDPATKAKWEAEQRETDRRYTALEISEKAISVKLKAPGSAKFDKRDSRYSFDDDDHFTASGYVDAQNAFGALLRRKYFVKAHRVSGNQWRADEAVILE